MSNSILVNIQSPITLNTNCTILQKIQSKDIIYGYKQSLNIDISLLFENTDTVYYCRCNDTLIEFYHLPYKVDNEKFYEDISKNDWYYLDERWEFEKTIEYLKSEMKILEIGCGKGSFLQKAKLISNNVTGIELNEFAVKQAKKIGLNVHKKLIEEFANYSTESYDVICSFQVLEHLMDLNSFMNSSLKILKPGGLLILSVPNNDSYVFYKEKINVNENQRFLFNLMNMPPHHFLCWNKKSLCNMANYFNLKVSNMLYEKLPPYLLNYTVEVLYHSLKKIIPKRILYPIVKYSYKYFKGHSIMMVFEKK